MPYVNFKEERCRANIQIEKRKKNNKKVIDYITKNTQKVTDYIPCKEYSFKKFDGVVFGKEGILDEAEFKVVESKDILCAKFIDCNFKNIKYKDCNFIGCEFINCKFNEGGVIFQNCFFIKEGTEQMPSLNNKDNLGCVFQNCYIYARFLNCDLSMALFENCNICNTSIELTFMKKTIIKDSEMDKIAFEDCNLSGFKTLNCYIIDLDFNDDNNTKFDTETWFDKIPVREKSKSSYEGLYKVYETICDKYKDNQLVNDSNEYYYLGKTYERKSLKKVIPKFGSYIYWISCGYGQMPIYPIITSICGIILFTFLYLFIGVKINDEVIRLTIPMLFSTDFKTLLGYFNEAFSLSIGMFSGVGFVNCEPIPVTYMIANIEMLFGFLMMGVGIATLIKKAKNN